MKSIYLFFIAIIVSLPVHSQSNQYLHFDGANDFVSLENGVSLLDGATQITMSGWFFTEELIYGQGMMSIRGGGDGDSMYLIQLSNGYLECRLVIGSSLYEVAAPAGTIIANTWQHVAWVFSGSSVQLFIDGVSKGTASASGTFHGTTKPFSIGKSISSAGNFVFKGRADEVSLWTKALSQTEIQNSMTNEFVGNESDLIAYYKFNQGIPDDDNTFITHLFSETGTEATNALLNNFALVGTTSNFGGVLDSDFQVINFPIIENKLISSAPFILEAYTSSGLDVSYSIESGPASVSGDLVTLDGFQGEVVVKARQAGNGTYNAAEDVFSTFQVLDPTLILPNVTLLHPTPGDVFVPELGAVPVALDASIEFTDVFSISDVTVSFNGTNVSLTNHGNGRYTGWWTPTAFGTFNVETVGTNNFGSSATENYTVDVLNTAPNQLVDAATDVWVNQNVSMLEVEATLPSFMGAYDSVIGTLNIDCPTGGCDPWDRVSSVQAQAHDGKWYEIIRYLTPYGVACQHEIDLTDFISLLQGVVKFRFSLGTQGNGFLYSLDLDYTAGSPTYKYSKVDNLWQNTYQFGDYANLQPCEGIEIDYFENVEAARIKLVSTGHGWGDNNTGNAAEFHHDEHNIWVDGISTFSQDNWLDCNPNPDGCLNQNGTWFYDRAGWCPGSIAPWFDFDLISIDTSTPMALNYIFDEDYIDLCHPNHPDCVSTATCDCNAGFNPHLIVSSYLISYSDLPILENNITINTADFETPNATNDFNFTIFPNPSIGKFVLDTYNNGVDKVSIYNINGVLVEQIDEFKNFNESHLIDISYVTEGVYFVKVSNNKGTATKKIIITDR